ncbi:MAG: AmmeMemoRadiSam system protein B [Terriglobia bacterium]
MQSPAVRYPSVAGKFYPADPNELRSILDHYLGAEDPATIIPDAKACVVPHAGYIYSGAVAGAVYRKIPAHATFVILGPNHFGYGKPLAITPHGYWQTPLGLAAVDEPLARAIQQNCAGLVEDAEAHAAEHSLEVQIPFLQRRMKSFTFVPIAIGGIGYERLEALGIAIGRALAAWSQSVAIIASSDMNHYEPDRITRVKDHKAIEKMLAMDPAGLYDVLCRERITMCGYGPVIAILMAAKEMGAREAKLEKYATSADAGADRHSVVGYAGMIIQ